MSQAALFLELANQVLSRGRQMFLVYDAQQALQLIQHLGGAAVLVDLDLQGNAGLHLMEQVRESFPALPVVAISRVLGVP